MSSSSKKSHRNQKKQQQNHQNNAMKEKWHEAPAVPPDTIKGLSSWFYMHHLKWLLYYYIFLINNFVFILLHFCVVHYTYKYNFYIYIGSDDLGNFYSSQSQLEAAQTKNRTEWYAANDRYWADSGYGGKNDNEVNLLVNIIQSFVEKNLTLSVYCKISCYTLLLYMCCTYSPYFI